MATSWRLNITAIGGGAEAAFIELSMHAGVQTANIAPTGTITASSTFGGYPASQLTDGILSGQNGWNAANGTLPQQVTIDFATNVPDLWAVTVTATPGFESKAPQNFDVQKNQDGAGWVTIWSVTSAGTYEPNLPKTFINPNSGVFGTAAPAPTYFRLRSTAPTGVNIAINGLTMHATAGGADFATTYAAVLSSSDFGGLPAANAFDGNTATYWHSNDLQQQWVGIQRAASVAYVDHITVRLEAGRVGQAPTAFVFETSANGWSYDPQITASGLTWTDAETKTFTNTTPVATTLDLTPASATLAPAATQQLTAVVYDQFAAVMSGAAVTYGSSAAGVATVSAAGLVTAVAPGSAVVTATSGSASDTTAITVQALRLGLTRLREGVGLGL